MAPVQLNCFTVECNYKTQALKFDQAEKILDKHREDVHRPAAVASGASLKIPKLSGNKPNSIRITT